MNKRIHTSKGLLMLLIALATAGLAIFPAFAQPGQTHNVTSHRYEHGLDDVVEPFDWTWNSKKVRSNFDFLLGRADLLVEPRFNTLERSVMTAAISIGSRVQTNDVVNVRQTPAGTILGTQTSGKQGTVTGGPNVASLNGTSFTWFNVDFDSGVDGWVADIGLTAVAQQCDIIVQGTPTISPSPVTAGNSITVSYVIHNNGPANAGTSQTKIQIKNSSGTQITSATFSAPAVSAGTNSSTQSNSVTIPSGTLAGTYTAFVILDNLNELNQSSTSNDFTAGVSFTVSAPALPDILPQNIVLSSSTVAPGGTLTVTFDIRNQGSGAAGPTTTRLRLNQSSSTTSASDISLGDVSTPAIAANTVASGLNKLVTIPSGTAAGTYFIWVVADNGSALTQSNVSNDFAHSPALTITVTQQLPDVLPQNVTLSSSTNAAGSSLTVTFDIRNQGNGNAATTTTRLRLNQSTTTTSPADVSLGDVSTPAIGANSIASGLSKQVTIPVGTSAGTYFIWVVADNGSALTQSNVSNDFAHSPALTVTVTQQLPDLLPQNVSLNSNSVSAGGTLTITFDIRNQGSGSAGPTTSRLRLNQSSSTTSPADISLGDVSTPTVAANSVTSGLSKLVTIPSGTAAGTYFIWVVADNGSVLTQSNVANDYAHSPAFTVTVTQLCDIVVQSAPSISPNPVIAGNSITVSYAIHNNGPANAAASQTKIQVKNTSGILITSGTFAAPSVNAGATSTLQSNLVSIPAGTVAGTYTIFVILDNLTALNQSNYNNDYTPGVNVTVGSAPPQQLPNLVPQNIVLEKSSMKAGETLKVSWTLANTGSGSAPLTSTGIRLSQSPLSSSPTNTLASVTTPALDPVSSISQDTIITVPAGTLSGTYYVWIVADNVSNSILKQTNTEDDFEHSQPFTIAGQESGDLTTRGIDVSSHNGSITWPTIANAGIKFAYIKATESTYEQQDRKFSDNIDPNFGAPSQHISVGAYHFATPLFSQGFFQSDYDRQVSASDEAARFLSVARNVIGPGFLPPALDIEEHVVRWNCATLPCQALEWVDPLSGLSRDNGDPPNPLPRRPAMAPSALAQWIQEWVTKVSNETHVTPVVYCNRTYASALYPFLSGKVKLWIADPGHQAGAPDAPPAWPWVIHQYILRKQAGSDLSTNIDLDVFHGDQIAFNAFLNGGSSPLSATVNTSSGQGVTVQGNGATITFANVSTDGVTTISAVDPSAVGSLPTGYQVPAGNNAFDITSTASFAPPITTCFNVPSTTDAGTFSLMRILHNENGNLVDRTTTKDFALKTICGSVTSLSPFAIAVDQTSPIIDATFFVRSNYVDFLNREPDLGGLDFWAKTINACGNDATCTEAKRINASAAFFLSIEFQQTGYLVERIYKSAYGDATGASSLGGAHSLSVPIVHLNEFLPDTQEIGQGVVVLQTGWEQQLENNKNAFVAEFVQRPRFVAALPSTMTPAQFVDVLNTNAGGPLTVSERNQLVNDLANGLKTRAQVLRAIAENQLLAKGEFNRAFVLMQYFGYLRRDPNAGPDSDYTGYNFWLGKLNQFNGNYIDAEMVKAFISSSEYKQRFGP